MAEDVVENVGFGQIIDLVGRAQEAPGDEAAVSEMVEEQPVGDEAGDGDDLPAGQLHQPFG